MVGVYVSRKENVRYQIISEFNGGKITRKAASEILSVSERTIARWKKRVSREGILGIKHRNLTREPANKIPKSYKTEVMRLVKEKYFDFNVSHLFEILCEEHGFKQSYDTLRRWCHEFNLVKHIKVHRRVIRKARQRMPKEGFILQMDGSHHKYNGKDEWCLIAAIDDATSEIPDAEFFKSESTLGCMQVLKTIIEKKGVPRAIYTDRAGWSGGGKRVNFNQFARACEKLGIQIIFANSPEAKGRIERAFKTIQDRIIPELRRAKITEMKAANEYLHEVFLKQYWNVKNTVQPKDPTSAYRELEDHEDLNEILCLESYRKINKDQTISWRGGKLMVQSELNLNLRGYYAVIRRYLDATSKCFVMGREVVLTEVIKQPPREIVREQPFYHVPTMIRLANDMVAEVFNCRMHNRPPDFQRFSKKSG